MAVLLYPFQITGSGYLEWARPIPSSRHHQKVALEGRANARRKLAAADAPRPPLMVSFGSRFTDSETVVVPFSIALWRSAHYSIFYSDSETWRCWSGVPSSLVLGRPRPRFLGSLACCHAISRAARSE